MGQYSIIIEKTALADFSFHKRSGQRSVQKRIERIVEELSQTPYIGVGNPHALRYELSGKWAREIDKKNRLVYRVDEDSESVFILSALGHYAEK